MADVPRRIQLRRMKGWRMPPNTVHVARPGKWGNRFEVVRGGFLAPKHRKPEWEDGPWWCCDYDRPFPQDLLSTHATQAGARAAAAAAFRCEAVEMDLTALRGKNLACWCPLDQPCHADVLLELANA